MFQIKSFHDGEEHELYDPRDTGLCVMSPVLTQEVGRAGSLKFQISPTHPNKDTIKKMQSEIRVYEDGVLIFNSRPLDYEAPFDNVEEYLCEGELCYLLDSQQEPFEHQGSINDYFTKRINNHNSQVEVKKQFRVGQITVVDDNNYINRSSGHYLNTLEALNTRLVDTHGGFLRSRWQNGLRYLDYISDYGRQNTQVIEFGQNILDLSKHIKGEGLATVIIPQGAQSEKDGINGVKQRIDISSVNGGRKYIVDETTRNLYGWICKTVEFDDVTLPINLLHKGIAYLNESKTLYLTIELTALDLSLIDVEYQKINLGDWIRVVSKPHGIDQNFMVSKMVRDLSDPTKNTITLGKTIKAFSESSSRKQKEISKFVKLTADTTSKMIEDAVENATNLMTGAIGGYAVIDLDENGQPYRFLAMDHPKKEDAVNLVQINKNGIGFSNTGINGTYRNAWTIDGVLLGQFIKAGSIEAEKLSVEYRSGVSNEIAAKFKVANDAITAEVSRATKEEGLLKASIKVNADAIKLKVSSGDVNSLIEQKANSIRLRAETIQWKSTYSSMSSTGKLKCTSAELQGTMKCGSSSGYWVELEGAGKLSGGYGSTKYGYIDYSASTRNVDTGVLHNGIQIQGGCLRISTNTISTRSTSNVNTTTYIGGTGTLKCISDIRANNDGSMTWWTSEISFENGLMVSQL